MTGKLRTLFSAGLVVAALALSATTARSDQSQNYWAHLDGYGVTPAVQTGAQAEALFRLSEDGTRLWYRITVTDLQDPILAGIHLDGTTDAMVACLYMLVQPPPDRSGGVLAEGVITAGDLLGPLAGGSLQDLANEMNAGNAVIEITTAENQPEIAGQIHWTPAPVME